MKTSYADYIKKSDVSVLVAEAIFTELGKKHPFKRIEEVADTTSGGTPLRENSEFYGGEIPWLKSGELNDGFIENAEEFITDKGLANSSAKLHPAGTLLIAMYGATTGKTGITKLKAATNQAVCAVFPKEIVERDYIYWFFRSHRYEFIEMSKGGAQPNISQAVILKTKLPIPSRIIQKEIISILERVSKNEIIDLSIIPNEFREIVSKVFSSKNSVTLMDAELTHQLDLIKQLRQAFLREAMQGKLVEQHPADEPASELLKKIKAEKEKLISEKKLKKEKELPPIPEEEIPFNIPENWVWCRLGEVVNSQSGGTPDRGNETYWKGNIAWLKSGELNDSLIVNESEEKITEVGLKNSSAKIFPKGTLLIALYGATAGKLGILNFKSTTNQAICGFLESSFINSKFLFYYLMNWRAKIIEDSWGQAQPNISQTYLKDFLFVLLPLPEQQRIVVKLEQLMETCEALEACIKESKGQNERLLQQVLREALRG